MIPLHLARIRGGMANPPLRCAILFVQNHADEKKRNVATVTIVAPPTEKRKRNSWVWKVMQQFEPPIRKCSVRCSMEVSKYGKIQPCGALFAWSGSTGTSTLASHIKIAHPSIHSELMVAGASSRESREERKDAERNFSSLSFLIGWHLAGKHEESV